MLPDEVREDLTDRGSLGRDAWPGRRRRGAGSWASGRLWARHLHSIGRPQNPTPLVTIVERRAPLWSSRRESASCARSGGRPAARPARSASPGQAPGRCRSEKAGRRYGCASGRRRPAASRRLGGPVGAQQAPGLHLVDPGGGGHIVRRIAGRDRAPFRARPPFRPGARTPPGDSRPGRRATIGARIFFPPGARRRSYRDASDGASLQDQGPEAPTAGRLPRTGGPATTTTSSRPTRPASCWRAARSSRCGGEGPASRQLRPGRRRRGRGSTACTSRPMRSRPGSARPTRTGAGSCCSTIARSTSCTGDHPRTRSPWCRCRSTSRTAGPRSSLALARGRKRYDKRHALAARDADLEARRASAARRRSLDA